MTTPIPNTTASGIRCIVQNISNENVILLSGVRLVPGQTVDLFEEDTSLTTDDVLGHIENDYGDLYIETTINNRVRIIDFDIDDLGAADVYYGHDNRIIFRRSVQDSFDRVLFCHESIVTPETAGGSTAPTVVAGGVVLGLIFTVDTDVAYRFFKVPQNYHSRIGIHFHWTKSQVSDQSGKKVRWQITYNTLNGFNESIIGDTQVAYVEDTYEDSAALDFIGYSTDTVYFDGEVSSGKYVSIQIQAVTPSSNTLAEPILLSADLTWYEEPLKFSGWTPPV